MLDLEGEGKPTSPKDLKFIHQSKTAALLTTSIRLGAMSANAPETKLQALTDFGQALGLAFQVIDDILDVTQTSEKLGKSAGKDAAAQKATYPAVFGLTKSRAEGAPADAGGAGGCEAVWEGFGAVAGAGGLFAKPGLLILRLLAGGGLGAVGNRGFPKLIPRGAS